MGQSKRRIEDNEEVIVTVVAVLLVLGLIFLFVGFRSIFSPDQAKETKQIKENIVEQLELIDQKLSDVGKLVETVSAGGSS